MYIKTGNISMALKIILFVITSIIVCVICAVAIGTTNSGKALVNSSTSQIMDLAADHSDMLVATYDGATILGNELITLINTTIENNEKLSIVVRTLHSSRTDYNYVYDAEANTISAGGTTNIQVSKAQSDYINRDSLFLCEVKKNINDTVICLWFEQQ